MADHDEQAAIDQDGADFAATIRIMQSLMDGVIVSDGDDTAGELGRLAGNIAGHLNRIEARLIRLEAAGEHLT